MEIPGHFSAAINTCQLWPPDTNPILPWIDGSYTTPRDTTVKSRMAPVTYEATAPFLPLS